MPTNTRYPTGEEILAERPGSVDRYLPPLREWKRENYKGWGAKPASERMALLSDLITTLDDSSAYEGDGAWIEADAGIYAYRPSDRTIMLDHNHPSIISALHELGHHLFGESELKACRFSVWLFKEAFPGSYAKLEWEGHMLKTNYENTARTA
jgi:hypothetical protein